MHLNLWEKRILTPEEIEKISKMITRKFTSLEYETWVNSVGEVITNEFYEPVRSEYLTFEELNLSGSYDWWICNRVKIIDLNKL